VATDLENLVRLAQRAGMLPGFKDGFPSGTPDTDALHGPNGLFGAAGLEQKLISTHVHGTGLATRLPAYPTQVLWPQFGYITGFQDIPEDTPPDGPCDDPPTVGHMKTCTQTAHFGLYSYRTREYNLKRAGELVNRGEPTDLVIINDPLLDRMANITPNVPGVGGTPNLRREFLIRMMELGVAFQRKLGRQVYTADPSNATNGGYDEFPGLDILISTGHIDAISQTSCPSLDSILADFAYTKCDDGGGDTLLTLMMGIFRYLRSLAEDTGLDPTEFILTMRRDLFYELTAIWPCVYMTNRCVFVDDSGQQRVVVNGNDMIAMRDAMRAGSYLMVDGMRIEVVTDAYIPEEDWTDTGSIDTGCFASDIYIIPTTVAGNVQSTYWQYFDYAGQFGPLDAAADVRLSNFFWTDGGRFFWEAQPPVNGCVVAEATIRPRLILRTPHLAARIQNVQYCPQRHTRDVIPGDSFWINGGVTDRTFTEPYSQWNPGA
jgi:hypothetical protein